MQYLGRIRAQNACLAGGGGARNWLYYRAVEDGYLPQPRIPPLAVTGITEIPVLGPGLCQNNRMSLHAVRSCPAAGIILAPRSFAARAARFPGQAGPGRSRSAIAAAIAFGLSWLVWHRVRGEDHAGAR